MLKFRGSAPNFQPMNNSTVDSLISFQFVVEFDHMTPDILHMFKVKWTKVKVTEWKHRLIAKSLLSFRKSGSVNLMVMSESWTEAEKW